jgi:predicted nucleic acid-binding protein
MPLPGGYLLDTNVLVHLLRNNNLGQFLDATYHLLTPPAPIPVSIVTIGELYALANKFNWGAAKRTALDNLLACLIWVDINDPQLLLTYGEMDAWSQAGTRWAKKTCG